MSDLLQAQRFRSLMARVRWNPTIDGDIYPIPHFCPVFQMRENVHLDRKTYSKVHPFFISRAIQRFKEYYIQYREIRERSLLSWIIDHPWIRNIYDFHLMLQACLGFSYEVTPNNIINLGAIIKNTRIDSILSIGSGQGILEQVLRDVMLSVYGVSINITTTDARNRKEIEQDREIPDLMKNRPQFVYSLERSNTHYSVPHNEALSNYLRNLNGNVACVFVSFPPKTYFPGREPDLVTSSRQDLLLDAINSLIAWMRENPLRTAYVIYIGDGSGGWSSSEETINFLWDNTIEDLADDLYVRTLVVNINTPSILFNRLQNPVARCVDEDEDKDEDDDKDEDEDIPLPVDGPLTVGSTVSVIPKSFKEWETYMTQTHGDEGWKNRHIIKKIFPNGNALVENMTVPRLSSVFTLEELTRV